MPNLHVSEFFGLASADQSTDIVMASAEALTANQSIVIGAVPGTAVLSAPFNKNTRYLRLVAGAACAVAFGPSTAPPVAVAGGWFLNAGQEAWVRVPQGLNWELSVVNDTL